MVNYLVVTPRTAFFLESRLTRAKRANTDHYTKGLESIIERFSNKVVAIVTDNKNIMKVTRNQSKFNI